MARILIIDDERNVLDVLEQTLTSAGYEVVWAGHGVEGMKVYRAAPVDLVITGIQMPKQHGLETIAALRREFPKVRIIAMCGGAEAEAMVNDARRSGAFAVLEKPFQPRQLLATVEGVLRLGAAPGVSGNRDWGRLGGGAKGGRNQGASRETKG